MGHMLASLWTGSTTMVAQEIGWELLHRGSCSLSAEKLFPASREAENLLSDKPLGCFLVRISQSRPGYTLTYRGEHRCRHYMIQVQPNVRYVILGEDRAHASLTELVRYHQTVGIQPFMEILTVPCGQVNVEDLQPEKGWGMDRAVSGHSHCSSKISLLCSPWRYPILAKQLGLFCMHQETLLAGHWESWEGERPWQVDDTPCLRMSVVGTDWYSSLLCSLGCVEGLQATAESTLPSLRKVVRVWIMKIWSASHKARQPPRGRPPQRSSPAPPVFPPVDLLCNQEQPQFSDTCGSRTATVSKVKRAWTKVGQSQAQARRDASNEPSLASALPYAWQCRKSSR
uniref:SH2 domain-containing protein n=1 Tax=Strix occidentalis caurina TaxID=311401 RepID=A0A8D0F7D3_STROC